MNGKLRKRNKIRTYTKIIKSLYFKWEKLLLAAQITSIHQKDKTKDLGFYINTLIAIKTVKTHKLKGIIHRSLTDLD